MDSISGMLTTERMFNVGQERVVNFLSLDNNLFVNVLLKKQLKKGCTA